MYGNASYKALEGYYQTLNSGQEIGQSSEIHSLFIIHTSIVFVFYCIHVFLVLNIFKNSRIQEQPKII